MFALIICPDERMWTISVWLYQFRQNSSDAVGFAALVLASLPVLVVFLFAQRVILRGIVLPVEK
jgi:multiple sugar transport system permease protein